MSRWRLCGHHSPSRDPSSRRRSECHDLAPARFAPSRRCRARPRPGASRRAPRPQTPTPSTPGAPADADRPRPPPGAAAPAAPGTPASAGQRRPRPRPAVDPAIARPQAQKLALEAVDQLQNGDEAAARATLDRALALDPANDLARKLIDQIRADAQKELGAVFFRYTVQRDDTLSKLAQQYLGDRFRFYILAKYNDITNPSRCRRGR